MFEESEIQGEVDPAEAVAAEIQATSHGRTILWNFSSLSASALITRLAGLATNAVLARRVSTSGFGIAGIAQSITIYFGLLADLGLGTVALREGAQNPGKLQQVISSMLGLRLILACAASLLGLIIAPHLPFSEASRSLLRLFLITLPIQALSVDWVFRAVQRMYWNTILEGTSAILALILTILLVRSAHDILRVAIIAVITASVTTFLGIFVLSRQGYHARPTFSLADARYYLRQSLPLCAMYLAILLYSQTNNLILGAVRGEADVGLYGAAIRLSQIFYQPIWLYFAALAPALMQSWAHTPENARALLATSVRLTAITSIGFALVAISVGPWLLTTIFGKPFHASVEALEILIWSTAIIAIGHNWVEFAIAAKKNRLLVQSTFLGAFVNLAVCMAVVSRMGIRGAALSNMFAEIAVPAFLIIKLRKDLQPRVLQGAAKPALAGAAAYGIYLATVSSAPLVRSTVTIVSFVGVLFLIGEIRLLDIRKLVSMIGIRGIVPEAGS